MPIIFHITIGISTNIWKVRLIIVNLVSNGHRVFRDIITIANPGYVVGLQSMREQCDFKYIRYITTVPVKSNTENMSVYLYACMTLFYVLKVSHHVYSCSQQLHVHVYLQGLSQQMFKKGWAFIL